MRHFFFSIRRHSTLRALLVKYCTVVERRLSTPRGISHFLHVFFPELQEKIARHLLISSWRDESSSTTPLHHRITRHNMHRAREITRAATRGASSSHLRLDPLPTSASDRRPGQRRRVRFASPPGRASATPPATPLTRVLIHTWVHSVHSLSLQRGFTVIQTWCMRSVGRTLVVTSSLETDEFRRRRLKIVDRTG